MCLSRSRKSVLSWSKVMVFHPSSTWQLSHFGPMALVALDGLMLADELELGLGVVERDLLQRDELNVAPVVVGVADLALFGIGLAVKPTLLVTVNADFLVAGHALEFEGSAEGGVAFKALLLDLGMQLGHLPRHDALEQTDGFGERRPHRGDEHDEAQALTEAAEGQGHTGSE